MHILDRVERQGRGITYPDVLIGPVHEHANGCTGLVEHDTEHVVTVIQCRLDRLQPFGVARSTIVHTKPAVSVFSSPHADPAASRGGIGAWPHRQRGHRRGFIPLRYHEVCRLIQIERRPNRSQQRLGHCEIFPALPVKFDRRLAAKRRHPGD